VIPIVPVATIGFGVRVMPVLAVSEVTEPEPPPPLAAAVIRPY